MTVLNSPVGYVIEIAGKGKHCRMCLREPVCITEIGSERIIVKTQGGVVSVQGRGLSLSVYENRACEIFGEIRGVTLGEKEK